MSKERNSTVELGIITFLVVLIVSISVLYLIKGKEIPPLLLLTQLAGSAFGFAAVYLVYSIFFKNQKPQSQESQPQDDVPY